MTAAVSSCKIQMTPSEAGPSSAVAQPKPQGGPCFADIVERYRGDQPGAASDTQFRNCGSDAEAFAESKVEDDDGRPPFVAETLGSVAPPPNAIPAETRAEPFAARGVLGRPHATVADSQATAIGQTDRPTSRFDGADKADAVDSAATISAPRLDVSKTLAEAEINEAAMSKMRTSFRSNSQPLANARSISGADSTSLSAGARLQEPDEQAFAGALGKRVERVLSEIALCGRSNSVFVALQVIESGVRVVARAGAMPADERERLRSAVSALLAEHGLADGGLIFSDIGPNHFSVNRETP